MPKWVCRLCNQAVSSAFERNLQILVVEHKQLECPQRNTPVGELPLSSEDTKFLELLKVGW